MIKFLTKICLAFLVFIIPFGFTQTWAVATTSTLGLGNSGAEVKSAQVILNLDLATKLATTGAGSPGQETTYFGSRTRLAVVKFQRKYGIVGETGRIGPQTRHLLAYLGPKLIKARNSRTPIIPTDWPEAGARTRPPVVSTSYSSSPTVKKVAVTIAKPISVKLSSLSPTTITAGGTVTIYGEGFTKTDNNIETKYKTISNISSSDGKTLTFSFSLPASDIASSGLNQFSSEIVPSAIVPISLQVVNGNGVSNELIFNYHIR